MQEPFVLTQIGMAAAQQNCIAIADWNSAPAYAWKHEYPIPPLHLPLLLRPLASWRREERRRRDEQKQSLTIKYNIPLQVAVVKAWEVGYELLQQGHRAKETALFWFFFEVRRTKKTNECKQYAPKHDLSKILGPAGAAWVEPLIVKNPEGVGFFTDALFLFQPLSSPLSSILKS